MNIEKYLMEKFEICEDAIKLIKDAESAVKDQFAALNSIKKHNQFKVLKAFCDNKISDRHFSWNTGYGYDDIGREAVDRVFASVFGAQDALVRMQFVNGTHAINTVFFGLLRPGDEMIYVSGEPYDSLKSGIGLSADSNKYDMGSLKQFGIEYRQVDLKKDATFDFDAIRNNITPKTKMICMQRATGYSWRNAIALDDMRKLHDFVRDINENIVLMVDNCYGEFLDTYEPTEIGFDIMAGSLIKNPGGGLALSGGYVAGRADLIEKVSYRLTCPGIGRECGLTFGQTRQVLQGLFMAPGVVIGALQGAILCAKSYEVLGYDTCPKSDQETRSDIIQAVKLGSAEKVRVFCEAIQQAAPVDSFVTPEPWNMPGYEDEIIMASGSFVSGSSIELSADAPMREPYIVYFQGGLTYEHSYFGILRTIDRIMKLTGLSVDN
jgi:cystathionine beta-lyase family protein involved in aluminum resistance